MINKVSLKLVLFYVFIAFMLIFLADMWTRPLDRNLPSEALACITDGGEYVQDKAVCDSSFNQVKLVSQKCWFEVGEDWPVTECYKMRVPENHNKLDGRYINFPVVIFRAYELETEIPMIHTGGGGPGSPMYILTDDRETDLWNDYWNTSLMFGADLIVMDPRGLMDPLLMCQEYVDTIIDRLKAVESIQESLDKDYQVFEQCNEKLISEGVDLNQYNSITVAKDIDLLRSTLGYDTVNVFGISYGTRYALTYDRDFHSHVNKLVLDGTVFNDVYSVETQIKDEINAYKKAFILCNDNRYCAKEFRNIEKRFWSVVSELDKKPLNISVTHPENYSTVDIAINGAVFRGMIFSALYDPYYAYELPSIVASVENRNGDMLSGPARDWLGYLLDEEYGDISSNAHFCYEEYAFIDRDKFVTTTKEYAPSERIKNDAIINFDSSERFCKILGVKPGPNSEGVAITTDTPVLFLHGELDPVLPINDVKNRVGTFENGQLLTFPNQSHSVVNYSLCAEEAVGYFFYDDFDASEFEECRFN